MKVEDRSWGEAWRSLCAEAREGDHSAGCRGLCAAMGLSESLQAHPAVHGKRQKKPGAVGSCLPDKQALPRLLNSRGCLAGFANSSGEKCWPGCGVLEFLLGASFLLSKKCREPARKSQFLWVWMCLQGFDAAGIYHVCTEPKYHRGRVEEQPWAHKPTQPLVVAVHFCWAWTVQHSV